MHKITVNDLPEPMPSEAVDNGPSVVERPQSAWPVAPTGFKVTLYAGGDNGLDQASNKKAVLGPATKGNVPRASFDPNGPQWRLVCLGFRGGHRVRAARRAAGWAGEGHFAVCNGVGPSVWYCVLPGPRPEVRLCGEYDDGDALSISRGRFAGIRGAGDDRARPAGVCAVARRRPLDAGCGVYQGGGSGCLCRWARGRMRMIRIRIRGSFTARMCWSLRPRASL